MKGEDYAAGGEELGQRAGGEDERTEWRSLKGVI